MQYMYADKMKKGGMLRTNIQIDVNSRQLFSHAEMRSTDTMEATFNVKDFCVIVALCKAMQADVQLHLGTAGTPLVAEAVHTSPTSSLAGCIAAELLLATVSESVQVCASGHPARRHLAGCRASDLAPALP
jgi:Rad9